MKCNHKYLYIPPENGYIGIYKYYCYYCNKEKKEVKNYKILFTYFFTNVKNKFIKIFTSSSRYNLLG
jgi:hypothetical protein